MLISVILPAYNAELYLKEAIDSVLAQTFTDFELLVINDGSIDKTEEIIQSYQDTRVIYIKNEQNLGLIGTLNKGMALAKGKYIARMDADDICLPERFTKQVDFLEHHPDYVICGTSAYRFYADTDKKKIFNVPFSDAAIRIRMFFNSAFIHPSVMFRTATIKNYRLSFNKNYLYAEDYEFWTHLLRYGKGYNLSEKLLYYRVVSGSQTDIGNTNTQQRKATLNAIHQQYIADHNINLSTKEIELFFYISNIHRAKTLNEQNFSYQEITVFFTKLLNTLHHNGMDRKIVRNEIGRFYFIWAYAQKNKLWQYKYNWKSIHWSLLWHSGMDFLKERWSK